MKPVDSFRCYRKENHPWNTQTEEKRIQQPDPAAVERKKRLQAKLDALEDKRIAEMDK